MTVEEMIDTASDQERRDVLTFITDMTAAGLEVSYYRGRNFWSGPAVEVDNLQDAMSKTNIRLQWDNMGRDFVVYPVQGLRS